MIASGSHSVSIATSSFALRRWSLGRLIQRWTARVHRELEQPAQRCLGRCHKAALRCCRCGKPTRHHGGHSGFRLQRAWPAVWIREACGEALVGESLSAAVNQSMPSCPADIDEEEQHLPRVHPWGCHHWRAGESTFRARCQLTAVPQLCGAAC